MIFDGYLSQLADKCSVNFFVIKIWQKSLDLLVIGVTVTCRL